MILKRRGTSVLGTSLVLCLLTMSAFTTPNADVGAVRIRFKRGESSTTVSGKLTSRRLKQAFVIGGKAGQELAVRITAKSSDGSDFANFIVLDPAGKSIVADEAGAAKVRLKQAGDYRIEVTPPAAFYQEQLRGYKELRFSLSVRVA